MGAHDGGEPAVADGLGDGVGVVGGGDDDDLVGPAVQGWWCAVNGFPYRVKTTNVNKTITVEVFKRYNYGNPAGRRRPAGQRRQVERSRG
ncbi:hypothetical protein ACIG0D_07245 [Streptomyces sp. NPDC052773]|uniref:hypothetical protein n=1 Tax=Streptomyces sp. NPDC052773 TaxID=3365693 RepID=UPI0037CF22E2